MIVLDTRYHRDPLRSDGSFLGDTQWEWLEKELRGPRSEITIIASSVQVPKPSFLLIFIHFRCIFGHKLNLGAAKCLIQSIKKKLYLDLSQVISNLSATTGPLFYMESWGRFPKERKRLFRLIEDTKVWDVVDMMGNERKTKYHNSWLL